MGRAKGKNRGDKQQKLDPLGKVIDEAKFGKQTFKQKPNLNQKSFKKSVEEGNILIDEKTTSKILKQANQQQDDLSRGIDYDELHIAELQGKIDAATLKKLQNTNASEDEDEDGDDQMQQFENLEDREDEKPDPNNPEQQVPDFELNEEDNKMFEMFMTGNKGEKGRTLQDEILAKLGQVKEAMGEDPDQQVDDLPAHGFMGGHITVSRGKATGGGIEALILGEGHENHPQTQLQESNLPPELVDMFIKVGLVMSKFRSTKFPKAFRQIPQLRHWEEALFHTRPDKWSAASVIHMSAKKISQKRPQN